MSKPIIHARSSVKRFGGDVEDYLPIHDFLDSSKASFPDNRHRALTHNSWFIFIVEKVFGHEITVKVGEPEECSSPIHLQSKIDYIVDPGFQNRCTRCDGSGLIRKHKKVSVRDVCEQHILEDFGGKFIPTVSDYLEGMEFQPWMNNAISGAPTSQRRVLRDTPRRRRIDLLD